MVLMYVNAQDNDSQDWPAILIKFDDINLLSMRMLLTHVNQTSAKLRQ